jgi:hypothetical protein
MINLNIKHKTDIDINSSHKKVNDSVRSIRDIIPKKYVKYNLERVISAKTYGYHTNLDNLFYKYGLIKNILESLIKNNYLSCIIAYSLVCIKNHFNKKIHNSRKYELNLDLNKNSRALMNVEGHKECNVFFVGSTTYLRVVILYMSNSRHDNIIIIPRMLSETEILKLVPSSVIFYCEDFITDDILEKYLDAKEEFKNLFFANNYYLRNTFRLDNINFYSLIEGGLKNVFLYLLPQAYLLCLIYEEIFNHIKPRNVIGVRVRKIYDRALYETAKKNQIKRYVLLHSNIGAGAAFINSMGHFESLTGVFAWGEQQMERIRSDPYSSVTNIYLSGSPLFDKVKVHKKTTRGSKKTILFAAGDNDQSDVKWLIETLNTIGIDFDLIIKVHPGEDPDIYKIFLKEPNVRIIPPEKSLEMLFPVCDIYVTNVSSSALQAMNHNLPVLFILIDKKWRGLFDTVFSFTKIEKIVCVVESKGNLKDKLCLILKNDKYRDTMLDKQKTILNKRIKSHSNANSSVSYIDDILI